MSKKLLFTEIISNAIIWVCIAYLVVDNFEKEVGLMSEGSVVAIVVAVIGAIVSIVGLILVTIKDTKKVGEVKEDTVYVKPKIDNIDKSTSEVAKKVSETIIPKINDFTKDNEAIIDATKTLVDDLEYHKRLRSEYSATISNKDYLLSGINNVFEDNAKLNVEIRTLHNQLNIELAKNYELQNGYDKLQTENMQLKSENKMLKQDVKERSSGYER